MTVAEGFTEHDNVEMAIAAPPRSYTATPLKGISPFGHTTPPEPVSFAVPNDFSDASVQKGLKSNSWFTSASSFGSEKTVRRIASAPNAKLLNMTKQQQQQQGSFHSLRLHSTGATSANGSVISVPALERLRSCRRTYSSSSIKVKKVEVGPSSFTKIRMLGKGDVGKVYMVRQKGSDRLYAMKGKRFSLIDNNHSSVVFSIIQTRDDQAQQDKKSTCRTRDPFHSQSSFHCDLVSLFSKSRLSLFRHGVLYGW